MELQIGKPKNMIVKDFFVRMIQGGTLTQTRTPTRHLTILSINRYILILNAVQESPRGHISEVELRKLIIRVERDKSLLLKAKKQEMDKKTLRRMVEKL